MTSASAAVASCHRRVACAVMAVASAVVQVLAALVPSRETHGGRTNQRRCTAIAMMVAVISAMVQLTCSLVAVISRERQVNYSDCIVASSRGALVRRARGAA